VTSSAIERARRHYFLYFASERRIKRFHLAEHITGRDLRYALSLVEQSRLRPLSSPRCPDQVRRSCSSLYIEPEIRTEEAELEKIKPAANSKRSPQLFLLVSASLLFKLFFSLLRPRSPRTGAKKTFVVPHYELGLDLCETVSIATPTKIRSDVPPKIELVSQS
jgi:hypothetical protein